LRGVLEPGVNSVGVPMSDAGAVSLALERLARDPSVLGPMGEAARATYELQFSPERVRHRLEELLGNRLGFRSVP
jgi:glycosyltransferase involved in cell wall biosynthesis